MLRTLSNTYTNARMRFQEFSVCMRVRSVTTYRLHILHCQLRLRRAVPRGGRRLHMAQPGREKLSSCSCLGNSSNESLLGAGERKKQQRGVWEKVDSGTRVTQLSMRRTCAQCAPA